MRCEVHCPKDGGGVLASVMAALAYATAAWFLAQVAVVVAVAAAVLAVLAVAAVPVSRRLARRVCVPRWSAAYRPPAKRPVPRPAVTTGQRAIESKMVTVTPDMILRQAIEEEAR